MKPALKEVEVFSNVDDNLSSSFGISKNDEAHVMMILRDSLYSDKIMAVIREYSANAIDANVMNGKTDIPIKVVLPTNENPIFSIRDFGEGLSFEEMTTVFTQYGASTKRDSNIAIGMLGIGSKSGFAYSDSFNIISYHNNLKETYVAVIDETNRGKIMLVESKDCDEDSGLEIIISVKKKDIYNFIDKARNFYTHFSPRPDIGEELPEHKKLFESSNGVIMETVASYQESVFCVMGCIPYKIDLQFIEETEHLSKINYYLKFDIGEVDVSASREALKYSDKTIEAIKDKLDHLCLEYMVHLKKNFPNFSGLEKRKCAIKFKMSNVDKKYLKVYFTAADDLDSDVFKFSGGFNFSYTHDSRRFILKDIRTSIKKFVTKYGDIFISYSMKDGKSVEDKLQEFNDYLKEIELDGFEVKLVSELELKPKIVFRIEIHLFLRNILQKFLN